MTRNDSTNQSYLHAGMEQFPAHTVNQNAVKAARRASWWQEVAKWTPRFLLAIAVAYLALSLWGGM